MPDRVRVTFQNTGREREETLRFVQDVEENLGVRIVWLEYCNEYIRQGGTGYREVSYFTAHRREMRKGKSPFRQVIDRYGSLPSALSRFCTKEMKTVVQERYLRNIGFGPVYTSALGFRFDERHRVMKKMPSGDEIRRKPRKGVKYSYWFPMFDAEWTARDVGDYWRSQDFDLNLPLLPNGKTVGGNCDGCFLKSEHERHCLARLEPKMARWWRAQEIRMKRKHGTGSPLARFKIEKGDTWERVHQYAEIQPDWVYEETDGMLCQANGGECHGDFEE